MAFSTYDRHWNNVNLCQYWLNNRDYLFCWNSLFNCSFLPDNLGSSHQPYFLKPETNFWVMVPRVWNAFSLFYSSYYSQYCIINFLYSAAHLDAFCQNLVQCRTIKSSGKNCSLSKNLFKTSSTILLVKIKSTTCIQLMPVICLKCNQCSSFSKCAFILKMSSFSKCAFIFKMWKLCERFREFFSSFRKTQL